MVEKKSNKTCGIFTMENIIIFALVIILIGLVFRYIQIKSNENYTKEKFDTNEVNDGFVSGETTCTLYYANWCPHCKSVFPFFNEWRDSNDGILKLEGDKSVKIQSFEEKDIPSEDQKGVEGFPTIKLKCKNLSEEYNGSRTKDGILRWLNEKIN